MRWLYYKLYCNISNEPKRLVSFTETGTRNMECIETRLGLFLASHGDRLHGFFLFRFCQDHQEPPPLIDQAVVPPTFYAELIRLRFRVHDADFGWAMDAFRREVIDPLEATQSQEGPATGRCLRGWRFYDWYDARGDLGARFGDLPRGVDPTEEVVAMCSAWTRLRLLILLHPGFSPNHDVVHLYYNTMGLLWPQELEALEARSARVRSYMERVVAF
jgi:hypothetical protein